MAKFDESENRFAALWQDINTMQQSVYAILQLLVQVEMNGELDAEKLTYYLVSIEGCVTHAIIEANRDRDEAPARH